MFMIPDNHIFEGRERGVAGSGRVNLLFHSASSNVSSAQLFRTLR